MLENFLEKALWIAEVVVGLGLLIFVHELGHFIMAKRKKVRVEIFSLGFGKPLLSWRRGETEYRISIVPLGGFVKMAGELHADDRRWEPWELTSKPVWQRFQIFVAGALMNLLLGWPLAFATFLAGMYEFSNEVGVPGVPEVRAGMRPGDVIVGVGDRRIENMDKYRIEMVRRFNGTIVPVTVLRDGREIVLPVEVMGSAWHRVTRPPGRMIGYVRPGSPADAAGLRELDEIVEADGRPVLSARQLEEAFRKSPGRPVRFKVRRRDADWNASELDMTVTPPPKEFYALPEDQGLYECVIASVHPGQPAWGALRPGDRIEKIDDAEIRGWQDLKDVVERSLGRTLRLSVRREGRLIDGPVEITPTCGETGLGQIGVSPAATPVFARVAPGSFYDQAGLRSGDELYSAPRKDERGGWKEDVTGDASWPTVAYLLGIRDQGPRTLRIKVRRGRELVDVELPLQKCTEGDLSAVGLVTPKGQLGFETVRAFRRRPAGEAVGAGLREPFDVAVMTFEVLGKLLRLQESPKDLAGPVGIVHTSMRYVELSFGNFLWLLCLITVNLGIFNLLPVPILDGGHLVLLGIEKLCGRPPSEKFMAVFQYSGLVFILALVVLVTFNDITRIFTGG